MNTVYVLGGVVVVSYVLQVVLGLKQLTHFNQVYQELRRKGRVAIGRRAGKIRAGTIVLFAVDELGYILDARKMQGVTIAARFRLMPDYIGQDIHYLDRYNPIVRKENRLVQIAIEDARELFLRVEVGEYQEVPKVAPLTQVGHVFHYVVNRLSVMRKKESN